MCVCLTTTMIINVCPSENAWILRHCFFATTAMAGIGIFAGMIIHLALKLNHANANAKFIVNWNMTHQL